MSAHIGGPQIAVAIDPQSVGGLNFIIAPRAEQLSGGVEAKDRMLAAMKQKDLALLVDGDRGATAERHTVRQLHEIGLGLKFPRSRAVRFGRLDQRRGECEKHQHSEESENGPH
jgi:hypothetical protein